MSHNNLLLTDMVQKSGADSVKMRYHMGDRKIRTELKQDDGQVIATIIDTKARRMLQLMTREKMYMEMTLSAEMAALGADKSTYEQEYEMKLVGTETINGYVCDKYQLVPKKQGLEKMTMWISRKLGVVIRTVAESHSMELVNIREGKQPASLFEIPKDYKKMAGMDGIFRDVIKKETKEGAPADASAKEDVKRKQSEIEKDAREVGQEARNEAKSAVKEEISETIRKGIRGIFGK